MTKEEPASIPKEEEGKKAEPAEPKPSTETEIPAIENEMDCLETVEEIAVGAPAAEEEKENECVREDPAVTEETVNIECPENEGTPITEEPVLPEGTEEGSNNDDSTEPEPEPEPETVDEKDEEAVIGGQIEAPGGQEDSITEESEVIMESMLLEIKGQPYPLPI